MGSIYRCYSCRKSGFVELKDFIENETFQVEAVEGGKNKWLLLNQKIEI